MNATTKNTDVTILDLDAMMDTNMDSVETLPDFVTPPPGVYTLKAIKCEIEKYKSKDDPKTQKQRIRLSYAVVSTKEVLEGHLPVADGSMFSETFTGTEDGIKYFKKAAMGVLNVTSFEGATLKDVMDAVVGAEFMARVTSRKTKDDSGKEFENINIRPFHEAPTA